MLFTLSLLLYVIAAVVLCAVVFKKLSVSNLIITFYLTFFCGNIIVELLLHFMSKLNNSGLFLWIQAILCLVVVASALIIGKPVKDFFSFSLFPVKE